ncbi:hypothetical protein [Bacillus sp. XF8]|uniref:hypothetical protein n=1 Tax=Bacillus sp. XF8 TaxID=2819289 RepID=UPI001AA03B5C|nr:hypothetical protein [Bacillus sp. XF8]MBO1580111.1 hypothetical protein [Bacillus sp. XF8]
MYLEKIKGIMEVPQETYDTGIIDDWKVIQKNWVVIYIVTISNLYTCMELEE